MRGRKAYIVSNQIVFVAHPERPAVWIKTHSCVVIVVCPNCSADIGEPCRRYSSTRVSNLGFYKPTTCYQRRRAARGKPLVINPIEIQLGLGDDEDGA